jgi:hypothetical protein
MQKSARKMFKLRQYTQIIRYYMWKWNLSYLFFIILIFSIKSCKSLEPNKPPEGYFEMQNDYLQQVSTVHIPVELNLLELEEIINKNIDKLLYEDATEEGSTSYNFKVWKKMPISVTSNGDLFRIKVPLKIWAKVGYTFERFGIKLSDSKETDFELDLHYVTKLNVTPDWHVSTHTAGNGFDWIKKPSVSLAGVKISLASFAENLIDEQQHVIAKEIDEQIKPYLNIKEYVQQAWNQMQQPLLVSEDYDVWLKVSPRKIMMTPIKGYGNRSIIGIGIEANTETFIGKKPTSEIIKNLPSIVMKDTIKNEFKIGMSSEISHESINDLLEQNFVNKTFTFKDGKYQVNVTNIKFYGSNDQVVVETGLTGSIDGTIYLTGKPAYDPIKQELFIQNLDFDLDTKNKIVKTASWLAKGKLIRTMQENLTFPLKDQLEQATTTIQKNLNNYEVTPGIFLDGNLKDLKPAGVYITPNALIAVVMAEGDVNLHVKKLEY